MTGFTNAQGLDKKLMRINTSSLNPKRMLSRATALGWLTGAFLFHPNSSGMQAKQSFAAENPSTLAPDATGILDSWNGVQLLKGPGLGVLTDLEPMQRAMRHGSASMTWCASFIFYHLFPVELKCIFYSWKNIMRRMAMTKTGSSIWMKKDACWDFVNAPASSAGGDRSSLQFKVHPLLFSFLFLTASLDGNRTLVTIIECICANGTALAPMYIFPGKSLQAQWVQDDPLPAAAYTYSPTGWTDQVLGAEYLRKVFLPLTADLGKTKKRLLALDGHNSHLSLDFLECAMENNIEVICLPSHSSDELQPLNVAVFAPLATAWSQEVEAFAQTGLQIQLADFAR
jgi:hypothetical protein